MAGDVRGRFLWYELMTSDPKGAQEFYTKVIGWGTQTWDGSGTPYVMWSTGETAVGGLMELPEEARKQGAPPHWLAYVGTPDVDLTLEQARRLGSRVYVPPTDIPSVGRFSVFADPQGATIAILTPATGDATSDAPPKVGGFSWHELLTTDYEAAFRFYNTLFGWDKTTAMDMGPAGVYQMFGRAGRELGGMFNKPAEMPAPPHWLLYVKVADINEAAERVKAGGGQVLIGPMEVPGGDWIVQCLDPQGAAFAMHAAKS